MSDKAASVTGNTEEANAAGTEKTAIDSADVEVASAATETDVAVDGKPATAGAEKTALASAVEPDADADGAVVEGEEGEGEKESKGEEADGDVVEEALADVELPEGITVSDEDKGAVAEIAKTHSLSKEAVKDLIALQTKRAVERLEQTKAAQREFIGKLKAEALALPKETLVGANKFIQKFGSDGLKAKMADPSFYIGNDADIINAFALAQKAVDGGFVDGDGAGGGSKKSASEVLYT